MQNNISQPNSDVHGLRSNLWRRFQSSCTSSVLTILFLVEPLGTLLAEIPLTVSSGADASNPFQFCVGHPEYAFLTLDGKTISGVDVPGGNFVTLEPTEFFLQPNRDYPLVVTGNGLTETRLSLAVPQCYVISINGVASPGGSTAGILKGDCDSPVDGTGVWQVRVTHKDGLKMEFDACDVSMNNGRHVLPADGVSIARPSIGVIPPSTATLPPPITWSIISPSDALGCSIDSNTGVIRAGEQTGVITVQAASAAGCVVLGDLELRACDECDAIECIFGRVFVELQSFGFRISLGRSVNGDPAGYFGAHIAQSGLDFTLRPFLTYDWNRDDVEVIRSGDNTVYQVKAPDGLLEVWPPPPFQASDALGFGYNIRYFFTSQVPPKAPDGTYDTSTLPPYEEVAVRKSSFNQVDYVKVYEGGHTQAGNYVGGRRHEFSYGGGEWKLKTYVGQVLVSERGKQTSITQGIRTVSRVVKGTAGQTILKTTREYKTVTGWGEVLIREVFGESNNARQNTFTYAANGLRRDSLFWDGTWLVEVFDDQRRVVDAYSAFLDEGPPAPTALPDAGRSRHTAFSYSTDVLAGSWPQTGLQGLRTPTRVIEYVPDFNRQPQEASRTYNIVQALTTGTEHTRILCMGQNSESGKLSPASGPTVTNIVSTNIYHPPGIGYPLPKAVWHPDGTLTRFSYSPDWRIATVTHGRKELLVPPNTFPPVVDGIENVIQIRERGGFKSSVTKDIASGLTISSQTVGDVLNVDVDEHERPLRITYQDNSSASIHYDQCCGLESTTSRDGVTTTYGYDDLRRLTSASINGLNTDASKSVTYIRELDQAGNLLFRKRKGTDNIIKPTASYTYNTAGVLTTAKDGVNRVTTVVESISTLNTGLVRTVTYHNNSGTRIEDYYRDGSVKKVTGNAVFPVRYEYGITNGTANGMAGFLTWRLERKLTTAGQDTPEWTLYFYDMGGRLVRVKQAAPQNQPNPTDERSYNDKGQLVREADADGVTVLFDYNDRGQLWRVAEDVNRNGRIDVTAPDGTDRIVEFSRSFLVDSALSSPGVPVFRVIANEHTVNGQGTQVAMWTNQVSLDGLRSWFVSFGRTNKTDIKFDPPTKTRYITVIAPDGSSNRLTYTFGRPVNLEARNSDGVAIEGTGVIYDTQGRANQLTRWMPLDTAYTPATFLYFDDDRVQKFTPFDFTPLDVPAKEYTFDYDDRGRLWKEHLPGGRLRTTEYFTTGLVKKRYGDLTYPIDLTYDSQGRLKTLTTQGALGPAVTTWNYYPESGLLHTKTYEGDSASVLTYTYTPAGRQATRKTPRGVLTTHNYNNAGDLRESLYSGDPGAIFASTANLTFSYDRRARLTQVQQGTDTTTYTLDDAGLIATQSINGLILTNGFDQFRRRDRLFANIPIPGSSDSLLADLTYDKASRLATVSRGSVSAGFGHQITRSLLRTVRMTNALTLRAVTGRVYDAMDRLTSVRSTRDDNPLPTALDQNDYDLNELGQREFLDQVSDWGWRTDNARWTFTYDAIGQLTSGKRSWNTSGAPVAGQQFEYTFDTAGNRTSTKAAGDQSGVNLAETAWIPNIANQLSERDTPGRGESQGYASPDSTVTLWGSAFYFNSGPVAGFLPVFRQDAYWRSAEYSLGGYGNKVWLTNVAVLQRSGLPDLVITNPPFLASAPGLVENYYYDADGNWNRLRDFGADTRDLLSWDAENRLIEIVHPGELTGEPGWKLNFAYDWLGRRTSKSVYTQDPLTLSYQLTKQIRFVWDGWHLVAELDATVNPNNPTLLRSYVWGVDESSTYGGAAGVGGLVAFTDHTPGGGTWFTLTDGRGNVSTLVNAATGQADGRLQYGPFGELLLASGSATRLPLRWSTKYEDTESGFVYYGHRYYDPTTGRWLSRDPIGEAGGLNLYGFVGNDPVNAVDTDGRRFGALANYFREQAAAIGASTRSGTVGYLTSLLEDAAGIASSFDPLYRAEQEARSLVEQGPRAFLAQKHMELEESVGTADIVRAVDYADEYTALEQTGYATLGAAKSFLCVVGTVRPIPAARSTARGAAAGEDLLVGTSGQSGRSGIKSVPNATDTPPQAVQDAASARTCAAKTVVPNGSVYSVAFETRLSPASYPGVSRGAHFQEANGALLRAMEGDAQFGQIMQQGGVNIQRTATGLAPRTPPPGWTWHHAPETGVMQLVPRTQHAPGSIFQNTLHPGGQGGYSIWGQ